MMKQLLDKSLQEKEAVLTAAGYLHLKIVDEAKKAKRPRRMSLSGWEDGCSAEFCMDSDMYVKSMAELKCEDVNGFRNCPRMSAEVFEGLR